MILDKFETAMVTVFFESSTHAEYMATFRDEVTYIKCLPSLEAEAAKNNMILTETIKY